MGDKTISPSLEALMAIIHNFAEENRAEITPTARKDIKSEKYGRELNYFNGHPSFETCNTLKLPFLKEWSTAIVDFAIDFGKHIAKNKIAENVAGKHITNDILKQLKVRGADLVGRNQSEVNAAKQAIADDLLTISKELQREPVDENDMTHVEFQAWKSKQKNQKSVAKDSKGKKAIKSAGKKGGNAVKSRDLDSDEDADEDKGEEEDDSSNDDSVVHIPLKSSSSSSSHEQNKAKIARTPLGGSSTVARQEAVGLFGYENEDEEEEDEEASVVALEVKSKKTSSRQQKGKTAKAPKGGSNAEDEKEENEEASVVALEVKSKKASSRQQKGKTVKVPKGGSNAAARQKDAVLYESAGSDSDNESLDEDPVKKERDRKKNKRAAAKRSASDEGNRQVRLMSTVQASMDLQNEATALDNALKRAKLAKMGVAGYGPADLESE